MFCKNRPICDLFGDKPSILNRGISWRQILNGSSGWWPLFGSNLAGLRSEEDEKTQSKGREQPWLRRHRLCLPTENTSRSRLLHWQPAAQDCIQTKRSDTKISEGELWRAFDRHVILRRKTWLACPGFDYLRSKAVIKRTTTARNVASRDKPNFCVPASCTVESRLTECC